MFSYFIMCFYYVFISYFHCPFHISHFVFLLYFHFVFLLCVLLCFHFVFFMCVYSIYAHFTLTCLDRGPTATHILAQVKAHLIEAYLSRPNHNSSYRGPPTQRANISSFPYMFACFVDLANRLANPAL